MAAYAWTVRKINISTVFAGQNVAGPPLTANARQQA
jgi:hypothetical protein